MLLCEEGYLCSLSLPQGLDQHLPFAREGLLLVGEPGSFFRIKLQLLFMHSVYLLRELD